MNNIDETIFYNILKFLNSRDIKYILNFILVNKHLNNISKNGDFYYELFNKKRKAFELQFLELLRNKNIILNKTTNTFVINLFHIPKNKFTKNELEKYYLYCSMMIKGIARMA